MINNLISDISGTLANIGYVLLAFVVLMVMITIHELGHYTAGKLLKFKINEFAIGMGPKIFSRKKADGEVFSIRLLPLGGFCAFEGEDQDNPNAQAFNNQKPWKRLIVLFAGAFFNFVSAVLIGIIVFTCFGDAVAKVDTVYDYAPDSNRELLLDGDIIYKVDGKEVYLAGNLSGYFADADDSMTLTVIRDGKEIVLENIAKETFVITSISQIRGDYYAVDGDVTSHKLSIGDNIYSINGIYLKQADQLKQLLSVSADNVSMQVLTSVGKIVNFENISKSVLVDYINTSESTYTGLGISVDYDKMTYSFGDALVRIVPYCFEIGVLVLRTIGGLLTGLVGLDAVGGPITTIGITSQVIATGFGNVLSLIVMISVNLAVFNLLPVPALDGCRMIFVIIEWIARRPINRKVEAYINTIGLFVLLALMVLLEVARLL